MSERDFAADLRLCEAATEPPWKSEAWYDILKAYVEKDADRNPRVLAMLYDWPSPQIKKDCDFIAAARTGWPAALREIERLRGRVAELEAALGSMTGFVGDRIIFDTLGMEHDEGCAEDDTCWCECFARCDVVMQAARKALKGKP